MSFANIIELLGTVSFTISGAFSAMQKRLDLFGVLTIGFVTAIGGGTVRDVLIGSTPVAWMKDMTTITTILITGIITMLFKHRVKNFKVSLFLFDALGLGLFTVIGIQKGIAFGLHPVVCVALGTITGCFGGVLRDILLRQIPALFFTREIYATACIIGGTIYCLALPYIAGQWLEIGVIILIFAIRVISYTQKWRLPSI